MRPLAATRAFSLSILAGAAAGAIAGIAARLAMRASAIAAGPSRAGLVTAERAIVGELTWDGTMTVVAIGVIVGIAGGALHALLRPLLPQRARGVAFGVAALVLAGWTILDPTNSDFRRFGWPAVNYATFAAIFLLYAVALVRIEARLDAMAPRAAWSWVLYAPIAIVGALFAFMNAVFGTDRHPSWGLAALAAIGLAHAARVAARRLRAPPAIPAPPR